MKNLTKVQSSEEEIKAIWSVNRKEEEYDKKGLQVAMAHEVISIKQGQFMETLY